MLNLKTLTIKNFLSIGENTQTIDFENGGITLILGENLDTADDSSVGRNGCGKSAILNALCYGLYGKPLDPDIKRIDGLVNNINERGMFVVIEFEKNEHIYKIERSRKPNNLKFYIDGITTEGEQDESQGENKDTQRDIERTIGISLNLFKHIVALNTSTQPFLSMAAKNQREFIEELLGISQLSEKAEVLKENIKETKTMIRTEEVRIQTIEENNKNLDKSIADIERRNKLYEKKKDDRKNELSETLEQLKKLNIEEELKKHDIHQEYNTVSSQLDDLLSQIEKDEKAISRYENTLKKLEGKKSNTEGKNCPTCGQSVEDAKHAEICKEIDQEIEKTSKLINDAQEEIESLSDDIITLNETLETMDNKLEEYLSKKCFYKSKEKVYEHKNSIHMLEKELADLETEENPYIEQIKQLKEENYTEVDYENINTLVAFKEHQEFLYKLLTNRDSFIRKRIIDQNLQYLNHRLQEILEKLGLPHVVMFMNDLTVDITYLGKPLDFGNLSRGEQTRLILALSWSFRDLFELIHSRINLIFIDELLDNGLDVQGVENAMDVVKREMVYKNGHESFIISHREELISKIGNVLKVVKQGGFTSFETINDFMA